MTHQILFPSERKFNQSVMSTEINKLKISVHKRKMYFNQTVIKFSTL